MTYVFEITPEGERLTIESRQEIVALIPNCNLSNTEFRGGTLYTNPLHLAGDLQDGSYIIFVEFGKEDNKYTPLKASPELRNWLRYDRHNTSYGAISNFIGRR